MRPWLKVRLPDNDESHQAIAIVEAWRAARAIPRHLGAAIIIYDALRNGDPEPLYRYFPGLATAQGRLSLPAPRKPAQPAAITYAQRSDAEELGEALGDFFGGIEVD